MKDRKPRNSLPRQMVGRMAAVLSVLGGLFTVTAETVAAPAAEDVYFSLAASFILGIIMWFLPWDRFGKAGTLTFMAFSLLALFFGSIQPDAAYHPVQVPVLLITLFAWNGIAHDRWTSLLFAPAALAAYVGPGLLGHGEVPGAFEIIMTMSFSVLTGEIVSWVAAKLTTAEAELLLNRYRSDFLTAAQHELRTPLTSIIGYIRVLESHGQELDEKQRAEAIASIGKAATRLERFASRLIDVDRISRGEPLDLKELGLLAEHYGDGEIDLEDPQRGTA